MTKRKPKLVYEANAYVEPLYAFVKVVASMSDETLLDVGPKGLYARQVDPGHVAMVEATLRPEAFQALGKLDAPHDPQDSISFAIDTISLMNALRWARRRKAPTVALQLREARGGGEGAYLVEVAYPGVSRAVTSLSTKDFATRAKMPTFASLPARVGDVKALAFRSALEEASDLADALRLRAYRGKRGSRDVFVIDAPYAADVTTERVEFRQDWREERIVLDVGNAKAPDGAVIDARYPLDYLLGIVKACSSPTLSLRWGTDYPIEVEWDITRRAEARGMTGERLHRDVDVGHVKALLAPRVDHDFDED